MRVDPWRRLRLRRWAMLGGWLGWLPFGVLVFALSRGTGLKDLPSFLAIPYMIGWVANGVMLGLFRCPRYDERFTSRRRGLRTYANPFTLRCLNCGQRAYEPIKPGPVETVPFRLW